MAAAGNLYINAPDQAWSGNITWASDTIKCALLTASYTPNLGTHIHWSDISANEVSGTGYTAGGATLASKTHTVTVANSWGTTWAASTPFSAGTVIRPATGNGFLYYAEAGGTSGATTPTWPTTVGATVVDSGVTWTCEGQGITVWSSSAPSWTSSTITAEYAVLVDTATGTASTEPLICLQNMGTTESDSNGTFTVTPSSTLGWFYQFTA